MEYTLQMVFLCENGAKSSMTVTDVKSNLTTEVISALMDNIVTNNIFTSKNGDYVSKYSAQVTAKEVTKHSI